MGAKTAAELSVEMTTNSKDAVAGFDAVGDASKQMARAVDASAEQTRRSLGVTADSADELGGKAGKATGALGALSSGFELLGPSGSAAAAGLQSAALATDFLSGVGDSLNLVMESTIVQNIRARAATIAQTVASKAAAAASKAMAAGQWLLNAALAANPIGLAVIAIAALVAGFILAYKKSETFRNVVNTVMNAVVGYIKIVTFPMRTLIGFIADLVEKIPGVSKAFRAVRDTAKAIGSALLAPFKAVGDAIQKIIDLIGKIKIPKIPDLNPFGRTAIGTSSSTEATGLTGQLVQIINLNGLLDTHDAVRTLEDLFAKNGRRLVVTGP